ncbi:ABC transporter substrate-binding protein [Chloroflexota bacterium]
MKRKLVWLAVSCLLVLSLVMSSCAQTPTTTPTAGKPEGTLVVPVNTLDRELYNPRLAMQAEITHMACWETLLDRGEDFLTIGPRLAERWSMAPDGLSYDFWLRQGIQFQDDWGELTAEDVKYSYDLYMNEGSKWVIKGLMTKLGVTIEVVDKYHFVFRLTQPTWSLHTHMTEFQGRLPIASKKHLEELGEDAALAGHPIGTGPWKYVERSPGESLTLEAVEDHWRQTPAFKTLIFKLVTEESTRIAMLRSGQADMVNVSYKSLPELRQAGMKILTVNNVGLGYVSLGGQYPGRENFDPSYPWVGDPADPKDWEAAKKVRLALNMAVNKEEIRDVILQGAGVFFGAPQFWPGTSFNNPAWKPIEYDPEQAKKLLAEAGYPNGFEATMNITAGPGRDVLKEIGEAVSIYWEKVGLKVNRTPVDWPAFNPQWRLRKIKGDNAFVYGDLFVDEPALRLSVVSWVGGSYLSTAEHPGKDELIGKTLTEMDSTKRQALYNEIGDWYYNNYVSIPICTVSSFWALGPRIGTTKIVKGNIFASNMEYVTHAK